MLDPKYVVIGMEFWGSLFGLLAAFYLFVGKSAIKDKYRALAELELVIAVMLFSDAIAYIFDGTLYDNSYSILSISNYISFICNAIMPVFVTAYLFLALPDEQRNLGIIYLEGGIGTFAIIWLSMMQFKGYIFSIDTLTNLYERGPLFPIWEAIIMIECFVFLFYTIYKHKYLNKKNMVVVLLFALLPMAAAVVQAFVYGYSLSNMAIIISALALFAYSLEENAQTLLKQQYKISKQNDELEDMQMRVALSQIKPAFLYDTLNAVYDLCDDDKAKDLVRNLAEYLKNDVDSIQSVEPIPFEKELAHTKIYLNIEKERYKDQFDVEYKIDYSDFTIPALTLQPLVENAVKHGVTKMPEGQKGLITIRTTKEYSNIEIMISDNGAGFDIDKYKEKEKEKGDGKLVGIRSVRKKLELMKYATLSINSAVGRGTTCVINIPSK
ncbi:sensor histidine kinase [Butyrivibrio proteoclasticus]|uniref:sensor histidine kinase n=1 Tax=Butyrivibrio proteoclasticus TaxID=43305 RepID=UPI00047E0ED1|nr:histidine kinase [Butyrivibrio proteoclasticus]